MKSLWIDDERKKPDTYTHYAKTYDEARSLVINEDWDLISFDHDLGDEFIERNGLTLMNILEEMVYFKLRKAPEILIHSANGGARPAMINAKNSIDKMRIERNGTI